MKPVRMTEIRQRYAELKPDGHWFDAGAMGFFKTVLPQSGYAFGGGYLFVTSETSPSGEKRYSVRHMDATGCIESINGFWAYAQRSDATAAMRNHARQRGEPAQ